MPFMETPEELAEYLADQLGLYDNPSCVDSAHVDDCHCRVVWVPAMVDRIRQAVANEEVIRLGKTKGLI